MFGIGPQELLVILIVGLLVLGPKRLPEIARSLGKGLAEFRRASSDLRQSLALEDEPKRQAPPPRPPAQTAAESQDDPAQSSQDDPAQKSQDDPAQSSQDDPAQSSQDDPAQKSQDDPAEGRSIDPSKGTPTPETTATSDTPAPKK